MDTVIEINPLVLMALQASVLPIVLGFVMRSQWSKKVKSNITLVVSLVLTFLLNSVNEEGVATFSLTMLAIALAGWAATVAQYNGYWHNIEINKKLPDAVPVASKAERPN